VLFGMFLDDFAVIMIFAPIFLAAIKTVEIDSLWYSILFVVNMQIAFLTPPYGFCVIATKAAIPDELNISMTDIYRAAIPFIGLQLIGLIMIMVIKPIITYLPKMILH
jgi:TRAP-type mannitol/chloroaromatic compound transport system permease large subunit